MKEIVVRMLETNSGLMVLTNKGNMFQHNAYRQRWDIIEGPVFQEEIEEREMINQEELLHEIDKALMRGGELK
jgi:hypothetical protein